MSASPVLVQLRAGEELVEWAQAYRPDIRGHQLRGWRHLRDGELIAQGVRPVGVASGGLRVVGGAQGKRAQVAGCLSRSLLFALPWEALAKAARAWLAARVGGPGTGDMLSPRPTRWRPS